ncbi:MAG TPA: nucleotidyltransferase domain-containing protein [Acidimicrobiales bacterium]|nr:nucleotidyltransferase domain-containing protein [Acidimicrobiales bacterium]
MDFLRPVEAVIPGAQGKLLAVFAQTTAGLSVRTAARLSGVSLAQTSRILPELAALGILERSEVPPSTVYRLVEGNVASRAIKQLARSRDLVLAELGEVAKAMPTPPLSIVVFGSFARGDAGPESDVDVVMVHQSGVDATSMWSEGVEEWRRVVRQLTGNEVEVMEVDECVIGPRLRSRRPVWRDISREGIAIFGKSLDELQAHQPKSHGVA